MPREGARANQLACRTREEFFSVVDSYRARTGMSLNKLSAFALGEQTTLPKAAKGRSQRIYLDVVDRVLTYIESNPKGCA